jgi:nucleotide-binding universal stress UspA family protein
MITFKKILCALDLVNVDEKIAAYATSLAKSYRSDVEVIYVTPPVNQYAAFEMQPKALETFGDEIFTGAEKKMRTIIPTLFPDLTVSTRIESGNPAEEIIKAAKEGGADLIVMGTHGRKGVNWLFFGSVAENVVKGSKIPVLTINPEK